MVIFDYSMVRGYPLQYYDPSSSPPRTQYFCFRMTDIPEDMLSPNSPSSTYSDSDTLEHPNPEPSSRTIKCGWTTCNHRFTTLDQLSAHVSATHAHSGPAGLFYCGWSGCTRSTKGFNARYKMLVHVRTHTNEKPHQCYQCEKSFSRAENLKIHSRSHSGEKPYVCPVAGCTKAYSNSSDRFKHTRTHQVEKPYLCKVPGCSKRYTDPSSLRKHVKTYKHFQKQEPVNSDLKPPQFQLSDESKPSEDKSHKCCLQTCLTNAAHLLKLGAFINNFNATQPQCQAIETNAWQRFINPKCLTEQMDVDLPLDLTIRRKS